MSDVKRIAMWSGPRNISTALMRSWGSRADTVVCDEPLYAHYLAHTQKTNHPGYEEIIAADETCWEKVVAHLLAPLPAGKSIYYQKNMAHHVLPHVDLAWTEQLVNCFLIREPREMLTSLVEFLPEPTIEETGLPMQQTLFRRIREQTGATPPVLDSRDVLENPAGLLQKLCDAVGVTFDPGMLTWEQGIRDTDGVWAKYWYKNVAQSTTFEPYRPKERAVPDHLLRMLADCEVIYGELYEHRLR